MQSFFSGSSFLRSIATSKDTVGQRLIVPGFEYWKIIVMP